MTVQDLKAPKIRKPDRRIQRTRQQLRDALIALVAEKGYEAVMIQDIADRANVNRTTFYLHFRDKEELLLTSIEEMYDELATQFRPPDRDRLQRGEPPPLCNPADYEHVAQHADFYRVMLSSRGLPPFIHRVQRYVTRLHAEWLVMILTPDDKPLMPVEMIASGIAGQQIGLITWWLDNNMPYTPLEMSQRAYYLTAFGVWSAMGFNFPRPDFNLVVQSVDAGAAQYPQSPI